MKTSDETEVYQDITSDGMVCEIDFICHAFDSANKIFDEFEECHIVSNPSSLLLAGRFQASLIWYEKWLSNFKYHSNFNIPLGLGELRHCALGAYSSSRMMCDIICPEDFDEVIEQLPFDEEDYELASSW